MPRQFILRKSRLAKRSYARSRGGRVRSAFYTRASLASPPLSRSYARADARGCSPKRHARDGRERREVRALAYPRVALFLPHHLTSRPPLRFLTPPQCTRIREPRRPIARFPPSLVLTSVRYLPSSDDRSAPTARGGYPRVRGGPHLGGSCLYALLPSRRQQPSKTPD